MRKLRRVLGVCATLAVLVAVGCAGSGVGRGFSVATGGAIELHREQLGFGTTLLETLDSRISNLEVGRVPGGCARLSLRGSRSLLGGDQPTVYVDGTRMVDTCILDQIATRDVERVEVYSGPASPPGRVMGSAAGLIMVYLRSR